MLVNGSQIDGDGWEYRWLICIMDIPMGSVRWRVVQLVIQEPRAGQPTNARAAFKDLFKCSSSGLCRAKRDRSRNNPTHRLERASNPCLDKAFAFFAVPSRTTVQS
jgi:hypothetical protein